MDRYYVWREFPEGRIWYAGKDYEGEPMWSRDQGRRVAVDRDLARQLAGQYRVEVEEIPSPFTCSRCGSHDYSLLSLMVPKCGKCGHWC